MPYRASAAGPPVVLHYAPRGSSRPWIGLVARLAMFGVVVAATIGRVHVTTADCRRTRAGVDCRVATRYAIPGRSSRVSLKAMGAPVSREGSRLVVAVSVAPGHDAAETARRLRDRGVDATELGISVVTLEVGDADVAARIASYVDHASTPRLHEVSGRASAAVYGLAVLFMLVSALGAPRLSRRTIVVDPGDGHLTIRGLGRRAARFPLEAVTDAEVEHAGPGLHRAVLVLSDGRRVPLSPTFHRGDQHHAVVDALRPLLRRG